MSGPLPTMRTGLARSSSPITGPPAVPVPIETSKPVDWSAPGTLVKLGLLKFAPLTKGVTEESLPETLRLDVGKILEVQNGYQRILVVVTGLLLTRQVLASKGFRSGAKLEGVIEATRKRLAALLDNPKANLTEVGKLLAESVAELVGSEAEKEWAEVGVKQMTSLLTTSTKPDDVIFILVGKVLVNALRGAVFAGARTPLGKALVSNALKRAGASLLVEDVLTLAGKIGRIADVNTRVHEAWYSQLVVDEI